MVEGKDVSYENDCDECCDCDLGDEYKEDESCGCPYCKIDELEEELDDWMSKYFELKSENEKLKKENEHLNYQKDVALKYMQFGSELIEETEKQKTVITIGDYGLSIANEYGDLYPRHIIVEDKRKG